MKTIGIAGENISSKKRSADDSLPKTQALNKKLHQIYDALICKCHSEFLLTALSSNLQPVFNELTSRLLLSSGNCSPLPA